MKNKPKDTVTLEWLLPSLNQQLSQVADDWQLGSDNQNPQQTVLYYHEIIDSLTIIDMPLLVDLATKLSQLMKACTYAPLADKDSRTGMLSHQLLQHELMEYINTGHYHTELLTNTIDELTRILTDIGTTNDKGDLRSTKTSGAITTDNSVDDIAHSTHPLSEDQYQQLLFVWRQQIQQLLAINDNHQPIITVLQKVSQYLKQTAHNSDQERLWHLTALWLCNLAHNNTPLPEDYASLLAQLGQAIESIKQHVSTNSHPDTLLLDNNTQALIEMVYVELLALAEIDDQTRAILNRPLIDSSFSILSLLDRA